MPTIFIVISVIALGLVLCVCLAIANNAYETFYARYTELKKVRSSTQIKAVEFLNFVNAKYFEGKIKVYLNPKEGDDAYGGGAIFLSPSTVKSDSLASIAILAHELGHALQDKTSKKLKKMTALRIFGRIIGPLMFPLLLAGVILLIVGGGLFYYGVGLASGGVLIFLLSVLTKMLTISIEKDASRNALKFLREVLPEDEVKTCKKFLNDCKLTYWGDLFRTMFAWTFLTKKSKYFR